MKKTLIFASILVILTGTAVFAQEDIELQEDKAREKVISEIGSMVNAQKYKTALVKCDNALKKYPDEAFLYYWKGSILNSLDNKKEALENFNKSIELNPDNPKAYIMRGICRSELEDKDGALEDYNKAIELDDKDSTAYSMRACLKLELGDMDGASEDLNLANKLMNSK